MSNYGSSGHDARPSQPATRTQPPDNEQQPLLPGTQKKVQTPFFVRLKRHLSTDVNKEHGDLILLMCYIITGLLDSSATAIWGAFVSMQTGNTVYLGLGIADPRASSRWIKSLTSIASFCLGSFCFSRFHRFFSPKRRWVLIVSFLVQLAMIVASAVITVIFSPSEDDKKTTPEELPWYIVASLALVGFQSSGQAVTSRALEYGGLTSVVLTSIYCDLFSDARLFAGLSQNIERNRRAAAPVLLLIGAVIGGFWSKSAVGIAGALWTAALLKALIVVAWLFWKTDKPQDA